VAVQRGTAADAPPPPERDDPEPAQIDVRLLAERVYRLMCEDLRLGRARGGERQGRS
jgi:hypothetical protein